MINRKKIGEDNMQFSRSMFDFCMCVGAIFVKLKKKKKKNFKKKKKKIIVIKKNIFPKCILVEIVPASNSSLRS